MLGYGGHFLTKSHAYSVTFGQLRKARTDHRREQNHPGGERDPWGPPRRRNHRPGPHDLDLRRNRLHRLPAVAELALASAARAREHWDGLMTA